jgi:hypothetical protein
MIIFVLSLKKNSTQIILLLVVIINLTIFQFTKKYYTKKQNQIQYTKLLNFNRIKLNALIVALLQINYYHLYHTHLLNSPKVYILLIPIVFPPPNAHILQNIAVLIKIIVILNVTKMLYTMRMKIYYFVRHIIKNIWLKNLPPDQQRLKQPNTVQLNIDVSLY